MTEDQIGPLFLGVLSLLFGCFSVRELALAYRIEQFADWSLKAFVGTSGLLLSGLFASCASHLLAGTALASTVAAGYF